MELTKLVGGLPEETQQFLLELLAVIQSIEFGKITPEIEIHQKKVVSVKFNGWKRLKYHDDNTLAISDLGIRIKRAVDRKQPTRLHFVVEVKGGKITQIFWKSDIFRRYS